MTCYIGRLNATSREKTDHIIDIGRKEVLCVVYMCMWQKRRRLAILSQVTLGEVGAEAASLAGGRNLDSRNG